MGGVTLPPVPPPPAVVPPLAAPFFLAGMTSSRRYFWRLPVFLELSTPSQKKELRLGGVSDGQAVARYRQAFACARPAQLCCARCGSPESKSSKGVASKIEHKMCRKIICSEERTKISASTAKIRNDWDY